MAAETAGHPDALAWFDVGYLAEVYKQWIGKEEHNPAAGLDGYAWVKKAISLRGPDPQMEFAAALITLMVRRTIHRQHVQNAVAGAKSDPLLAENLAARFMGGKKQLSGARPRHHVAREPAMKPGAQRPKSRDIQASLLLSAAGMWDSGLHARIASHGRADPVWDPDLVAHEWGTFTSIGGDDGQAVEWLPLTGRLISPVL